jgi:hypothetical protein
MYTEIKEVLDDELRERWVNNKHEKNKDTYNKFKELWAKWAIN